LEKLTWEVQERTDKVNFLDLWISFPNGKLQTSIYEKPMNLYLYLPPKSAHSPGVLHGTVIGTIYRYWRLITSDRKEFQSQCEKFFHRLIALLTRQTSQPFCHSIKLNTHNCHTEQEFECQQ
jgi:hypothetical protein